jgi:hypothetical protein
MPPVWALPYEPRIAAPRTPLREDFFAQRLR